MKTKKLITSLLMLLVTCGSSLGQGRELGAEDPEVVAKRAQVWTLLQESRELWKQSRFEESLPKLELASSINLTIDPNGRLPQLEFARALMYLGRFEESAEKFKSVFFYDPRIRDLICGADPVFASTEYATVLAKLGRADDAKAAYYFCLRRALLWTDRNHEPVPFITVFDPDPEGAFYHYSQQRLEGAALMIMTLFNNRGAEILERRRKQSEYLRRVNELFPEWAYLSLYTATLNWKSNHFDAKIAEAQALARQTVERDLVDWYRAQREEHLALNVSNDTPGAYDSRPMTEGIARRARMQCLKPNEEILKRISSPMPN